jgi:hypothetical protein
MNYNVTINLRPTAELAPVLDKISATLRKYLGAASTNNCLDHCVLGKHLLSKAAGIKSEVHIGWCAQRVSSEYFVTTHPALADLSTDPLSIFHAWLFLAPDKILDFTLYQLPLKISRGMTITWDHPPYLFISQNEVSNFRDVCGRCRPGVVYYQRIEAVESKVLADALPLGPSEFDNIWRLYQQLSAHQT